MGSFKEWWLGRVSVIDLSFRVALSGVHVRIQLLDYGITFGFSLPYCLDRLNPIHWITRRLFRFLRRLCGSTTKMASMYQYWFISKHKSVEIELSPNNEILQMEYQWSVHKDHWGHWLSFGMLGIEGSISYHDNRHWDYDAQEPCDNTK